MKLTKKIFSVVLAVIMILSIIPITSYASSTPSTKKQDSSVAVVSEYYYDYASTKYYFDSLQDAFDYYNSNSADEIFSEDGYFITLLKDVELENAISFTDEIYSEVTMYLELNGHNVNVTNGDAFDLDALYCNVFVNAYQQAYAEDAGIDGYGSVYAKDYAFKVTDGLNLVIAGGTYSSETKDAPFYVDDAWGGICNIRQSAIINTPNIVYNEKGYFGEAGENSNVFLRHVDGDHLYYFHVKDGVVGGKQAYIVEAHDEQGVTTIAPDRQSATIDNKCVICGNVKKSQTAKALIGDKGYLSIAAALVTGVADGETATVELLDDDKLSTSVNVVNNKNITLELNNHAINHTAGYFVVNGGELTIQNGTINSSSNMTVILNGTADSSVDKYSTLNINNATISNTYPTGTAIHVDNPLTNWGQPDREYGIDINIDGSAINSNGFALAVNGNYRVGENVNDFVIKNSSLTSNEACAMFISGYSVVDTIATSYTGLLTGCEIRAGILNIKGNENSFTSTTTEPSEVVFNHSGTSVAGAGLGVSQHMVGSNFSNPIVVNVEGGEFTGPVGLTEAYTLEKESYKDTTINVTGGRFVDTSDEQSVSSENCSKYISGGTYTTKPKENYIKDGYKAIYDGAAEDTWTIRRAIVFFNSSNTQCDDLYHEVFTYEEIEENDNKVTPFTSIPKLNDRDSNVFIGWSYDDNDQWFNMNDTMDNDRDTYINANWYPITTIQKNPKDEKNIASYKSFGLAGVQIREENTKELNKEEVYGGLRYVASLSDDLYNALNEGNMQVLEYGFVVATKENADINANGDSSYMIKNGDKNVRRINCANSQDHRTFANDYRLFTMVIDYEGNEELKDTEIVARAYIAYRDANGVARIFYNDYDGTNTYGGCSVSYNQASAL